MLECLVVQLWTENLVDSLMCSRLVAGSHSTTDIDSSADGVGSSVREQLLPKYRYSTWYSLRVEGIPDDLDRSVQDIFRMERETLQEMSWY